MSTVIPAFGEELARTGSTNNRFPYVGEYFDANAGWYYNRARWMDPEVGRFTSVDPWEGDPQSPVSLHGYLYANVNPIFYYDPTGRSTLTDFLRLARRLLPDNLITAMAFGRFAHHQIEQDVIFGSKQLPLAIPEYPVVGGRVDIFDKPTSEMYEIKPDNNPFDLITPEASAQKQLNKYMKDNPGYSQGTVMLSGYINNPNGIRGIYIEYYSTSPGIVLYEGGINAEGASALVLSISTAYFIIHLSVLANTIGLFGALGLAF